MPDKTFYYTYKKLYCILIAKMPVFGVISHKQFVDEHHINNTLNVQDTKLIDEHSGNTFLYIWK